MNMYAFCWQPVLFHARFGSKKDSFNFVTTMNVSLSVLWQDYSGYMNEYVIITALDNDTVSLEGPYLSFPTKDCLQGFSMAFRAAILGYLASNSIEPLELCIKWNLTEALIPYHASEITLSDIVSNQP